MGLTHAGSPQGAVLPYVARDFNHCNSELEIMQKNELMLIVGMAVVTFAVRYPVLALVSRMPVPPAALKAMRFIPPAVLTAIIVPAILMPDGTSVALNFHNSYLIASIVAGLVAWRSQNLLLTIVIGMLTFGGWRWLMFFLSAH